jgi:hypothetical protein
LYIIDSISDSLLTILLVSAIVVLVIIYLSIPRINGRSNSKK